MARKPFCKFEPNYLRVSLCVVLQNAFGYAIIRDDDKGLRIRTQGLVSKSSLCSPHLGTQLPTMYTKCKSAYFPPPWISKLEKRILKACRPELPYLWSKWQSKNSSIYLKERKQGNKKGLPHNSRHIPCRFRQLLGALSSHIPLNLCQRQCKRSSYRSRPCNSLTDSRKYIFSAWMTSH